MAKGDEHIQLELRHIDGQLTLLAFSSLDTLIAACGEDQPWAGLTEDVALGIAAELGAVAVLDPPLAAQPAP